MFAIAAVADARLKAVNVGIIPSMYKYNVACVTWRHSRYMIVDIYCPAWFEFSSKLTCSSVELSVSVDVDCACMLHEYSMGESVRRTNHNRTHCSSGTCPSEVMACLHLSKSVEPIVLACFMNIQMKKTSLIHERKNVWFDIELAS